MVMRTSDNGDGFGNCVGGGDSVSWSLHLCPATPIEGAQAVA